MTTNAFIGLAFLLGFFLSVDANYWLFRDKNISKICVASQLDRGHTYAISWHLGKSDGKNKVKITNTSNQIITSIRTGNTLTSTIVLKNVTRFEDNLYHIDCYLVTDGKEDRVALHYLEFVPLRNKNMPNVAITVQKSNVDYGEEIMLNCTVRGNLITDKLDIEWRKDGKLLKRSNQSLAGEEVNLPLIIKSAEGSSGGMYICRATKDSNSVFFQANDTVSIVVFPKLIEPKKKVDHYFSIGDKVSVLCNIDGFPLSITWQKKSAKGILQNVSDGGHFQFKDNGKTLTIDKFQSGDATDFVCKSKDKNGTDIVQTITLTLKGSCPVPTAVGDTASGKSTALKLIGSLMGMHMVSQSSGEFIVSDLTKTTIPLCWDDPTFPSLLRQPLVSVFNGLGNQTQVRGNERPLTSFLLTINFKMDDDMRSFERTTPIWFNKLVNNENEVASDFLEARKQIFSIASTHSIVDIISMGKEVNDGNLADHISFFKANLSGLPSRLAEIYSVYRLLSHEFIKLVDDDLVLTTTSFDEYLTDEFLPYVKSFYDVSVKAHTTLEEVFRLLVQAIAKLHLTKCEVGKWMRPNVRNKTSGQVRSIVFVIPTAVAVIGKAKLPEQPTEKNVRDLVSKIDGANGEYKSTFLDQPKKISCVKVPRYSLSNDILGQIDKLFDEQPTEQQTAADNVEEESCQECKTKARELTEIKSNHNNEKEELKVKYERQLEDLSRKWTHQLKEEEKKNAALKQEINSLKHQLEHAKVEVRSMKSKQNQQSSCSQSSSVAQAIAGIVETQNSLTINASSLDDSGIGEELEVTKEVDPTIRSDAVEKSVTLIPGQQFSLECDIHAVPLCITWRTYEPGKLMKSDVTDLTPGVVVPPTRCNGKTLRITNVTAFADGQIFSCSDGDVAQNISAVIMTKPHLYGPSSKEVKVEEGDDATLNCDIAVKPLNITWSVDGHTLSASNKRYMISSVDPHIVNIKDVDYDDRNSFFCSAKNVLDPKGVKQEIILRVKDPYAALWPAIGIVVAAVVVAVIIGVSWYVKKRRDTNNANAEQGTELHDGEAEHSQPLVSFVK